MAELNHKSKIYNAIYSTFKSYSSHSLNSENDRTSILSWNYVHNEHFLRKIERNVTRHRLVLPLPIFMALSLCDTQIPYCPKLCFLVKPGETHRIYSVLLFHYIIENKTAGFNLLQILGVRPLSRGCHKGCKGLRRWQLALLPPPPWHQLCFCFIYWASIQVLV